MRQKIVRVAIYIRCSTDRQEDSPERQRGSIDAYVAARPHWKVIGVYVDVNEKGWTADRPEFKRLLKDVLAGKVDVIVVDQGSRLSRQKPAEFFGTVAWPLMEAKVRVESVQRGGPIDWDDIGEFIVQAVDQHSDNADSKNAGWQVLSEWVLKAQRGELMLGAAPYGYRKGKDAAGRPALVPGPDHEQEVVRYVFHAYGDLGMSLAEVGAELRKRGAAPPRAGGSWRASTLQRWLRDPVYIGTYRFNRVHQGTFYRRSKDGIKPTDKPKKARQRNAVEDWIVVQQHHVGLVDADLFDRVQDTMTRNRKATTPGHNRRDFLLAGLLVCPTCKCKMTGTRKLRAGSEKCYGIAYRCASGYDAGRCLLNTVEEPEVLAKIVGAIEAWLSPEKLDRLRAAFRRELERVLAPTNLDPLREERAKLERQIARAARTLSLLDSDEDVLTVQAALTAWRERVASIDATTREAERPAALDLLDEALKEAEKCIWELRDAVQSADQQALRAALRRLIDRVEVSVTARAVGKNRHEYDLTGGRVHLRAGTALTAQVPGGCLDLSQGGACAGQAETWAVAFGAA